MTTERNWRMLSGGLWGVTLLLAAFVLSGATSQKFGSGVEGPYQESATSPSAVDFRTIPLGGPSRPSKPFLHPGGQAELDREKAEAERLEPQQRTQSGAPTPPSPPQNVPE